ncbi:MAG TPA: flagellar hook-associated protein FlgL [Solirubrobacteraceae bacterium]|jgi:flagellar hook-associated protein 3 FlgL
MSARITTMMVSRNVLADINSAAARLDHTRAKSSSGKELTRPSDNPYAVARALRLRQTLEGTHQHQRNASDAIGWQEATEQALSEITEAGQKARDLIVQAGNDTATPASRTAIAAELSQIIQTIKEHGNATYAGRFLFGGTETQSPPYPAADATDAYRGNDGLIAREIGPNVSLAVNVTGPEVLGTGQTGLLGVLRTAVAHLAASDGAALRDVDVAALDGQLDRLMGVRADNGAKSNRIESALSRLAQFEESTLSQLSETEDADFAQVMIDLNSQQAAYNAALKSGANIVQSSLMDFLR